MTADRLREAAKVLRERAEAATPGPWGAYPDKWHDVPVNRIGSDGVNRDVGITPNEPMFHNGTADAAYIATMHPGVGLALADWLDEHALDLDSEYIDDCICPAERVADLILGGES